MRVLVLDGGGSKGFFTLEVLRYLEVSCGRPIRECFDLIVGTSIGGFIAGLLAAGKTIDDIEAEFLPLISRFSTIARPTVRSAVSRIFWGHVLDAADWADHMHTLIGDITLADLPKSPQLLLVAADASLDVPHPYLLRNYSLPEEAAPRSPFGTTSNMRLIDALRAITAAPTIYPAHTHEGRSLIDGGIVVNNPIFLALAEVNLLGKTYDCVVSVGTGVEPRLPYPQSRGILGWTWAIIRRSMDSDTLAETALGVLPPSRYVRFDPTVVGACKTWESDPEVLRKARRHVQDYMHSHEDTLVRLVPLLFPQAQDNEGRSVSNAGGS